MTDNEKRAHDLAIMISNYVMQPNYVASQAKAAGMDGEINATVDPYKNYVETYKMLLPLINKDFPD